MKGKLLFIAGAAVGYVLGARAGRKRYEQIAAATRMVWESPGIQNQVHQAQEFAAARVGELPGAVVDGVKKVATAVSGHTSTDDTTRAEPAAKAPTTKSTRSSTGKKAGGTGGTKAAQSGSKSTKSTPTDD